MAVMVAITVATAAIKVGMATYEAYDATQKEAAMDVLSKVKANLGPDYTLKVLESVKGSTKTFIYRVEQDFNRKMMPDWTDANKRAGNATYDYFKGIFKAAKVPLYEQMRFFGSMYMRFGNGPKKSKYKNLAKSLWPMYKGYFKTGKYSDTTTPTGGSGGAGGKGDKKKVSQQQMLLLGAGALVVLLLVMRRGKNARVA